MKNITFLFCCCVLLVATSGQGAYATEGERGLGEQQTELPAISPSGVELSGSKRDWLAGIALWYEELQAKIRIDIETAEAQAAMAENLLRRAQAARNAAVQELAQRSLDLAAETRATSESQWTRVVAALERVRQMQALSDAQLARINCFTTGIRGEVKVRRAGSAKWMDASVDSLATLADGDVIAVGRDGRIEMHLHDAAGLLNRLKLGPDTTIKVQVAEPVQDDSLELFLEKGSLYTKVTTTGPEGEEVKRKRTNCVEKFLRCLPANSYINCLKMVQVCSRYEWWLRGSGTCSVRGTEFLLEEDGQGNSRCVVFAGSLVYHSPKLGRVVIVEKGEAVNMNAAGEFSPLEKITTHDQKGWWAE